MEVLRQRNCSQNPLPSASPPSSPPATFGGSTTSTCYDRSFPRRSKQSGEMEAAPHRRSPSSSTKPFLNNQNNSHRNRFTSAQSERRSRIPQSTSPMVVKSAVKKLVMEEVTILKRGEVLKDQPAAEERLRPRREEEAAEGGDLALCSTDRLGPDPKILPKETRLVDQKPSPYAGWGFITSPSPSSLPFPTSFFARKDATNTVDLATKGLRYLLRLDLP